MEVPVPVNRTSLDEGAIVAHLEPTVSVLRVASPAIATVWALWIISATWKLVVASVDRILTVGPAVNASQDSGTSRIANGASATDTRRTVTRKLELASIVAITRPVTTAIDASKPTTVILESGWTFLAERALVQV